MTDIGKRSSWSRPVPCSVQLRRTRVGHHAHYTASSQKIYVDGQPVQLETYSIKCNNCAKI